MHRGERVLVIGATRGTGFHIVGLLLREGYRVRVLARSDSKARDRFGDAVEIAEGDVTKPESLPSALRETDHLILTVGVTKRPAAGSLVRAVEFDGTRHVLAAAAHAGLAGRFMYMSAIGTTRWSISAFVLNLIKGNTLRWRRRAEEEIRGSGLDYTIVHSAVLAEAPPNTRAIDIGQRGLPMSLRYRIGRQDVAEVFVRALVHPRASRTTFDAVWSRRSGPTDWDAQLDRLRPDAHRA